jgi:hypothetical protein
MPVPRKARSGSGRPRTRARAPGHHGVAAELSPPTRRTHPPTHEHIALRAWFLWDASPFHDSDPLEDWLTAERQLWDEYLNGAAGPTVGRLSTTETRSGLVLSTPMPD